VSSDAEGLRAAEGRDLMEPVGRAFHDYGLLITLLAFVVVFSILSPDVFFSWGTAKAILTTQTVLAIVALALTLPLATGEFDLSIGFNVAFASSLLGVLSAEQGIALPIALGAALGAGLLIGLINGWLVVYRRVNAFVATLGTGSIVGGLTLAITDGRTITGMADGLVTASRHELLDLPLPTYYALLLAFILWYIYEHTPLGRYILFVGESEEAARLAGVAAGSVKVAAFAGAGALCAFAGILNAGQLDASDPTVATSYLLPAFAAAFLGSTTIKPGRFNAWGTIVAILVLTTGITGLQLEGAPYWVEPLFNGIALTVAVIVSERSRAKRD